MIALMSYALLVSAIDVKAAAAQYESYANTRFGFSVEIPKGLIAETPPTNRDGQAYHARNSGMRLVVSAIGNAAEDTLATFTANDMAACLHQPPEYAAHHADWTVFSCTAKDGILYQKTIETGHGADAFFTSLRIVYPVSERARWNAAVAHAAATLTGALHDDPGFDE